jgi:hypothetical protein
LCPAEGSIAAARLCQLIRQGPPIAERSFTIAFLGPGAQAFNFMFG